jgi:peptidoglycan hydrolase-like protein with peptidoglycan-binding domain
MANQHEIPEGLEKDSTGADVTHVQEYLERFGYLGPVTDTFQAFGAAPFPLAEGDEFADLVERPTSVNRGTFDDATAEAVRRFQEFANLPVTGVVDAATAEKMNQPRCGIPDAPDLAAFVTTGRKWATNNLRYASRTSPPT